MGKVRVAPAQGARGKWRCKIYYDGQYWGMSSIKGYGSKHEALAAAVAVFGQDIVIEYLTDDEEGGDLYAGPRDFDNI